MVYGKSFLATHKQHATLLLVYPKSEGDYDDDEKKFCAPQDDFFSHPKNIPLRLPPKLLRPKSGLPMSISFCGPPALKLFTSLGQPLHTFLLFNIP